MKPHIQKTEPIDLSKQRITATLWQVMEIHEEHFKERLWQAIAPLFEHVDGYGQVIQKETLRKAIFNDKERA